MVNYLYIHIPFCTKKCLYCDFNSIPFDSNLADRYVSAICNEIISNKAVIDRLKTVYIGGGTPTTLNKGSLRKILKTITDNCYIDSQAEITVEANPESISEKKAEEIIASGINRISIGVQSLVNDDLLILGRIHTAEDAIEALKIIKMTGFNNISVDLIYGIPRRPLSYASPSKDLVLWQDTLIKTANISPEHISIYELTPECHTPLYNEINLKNLLMPDENVVSEMYYCGKEILERLGYVHYEISNFAKSGYECKHNLNYWDGEDYLGIGAGAHSFVGGVRYSNISNVHEYIISTEKGSYTRIESIELTPEDRLQELIFLGLRKIKGIELKRIPQDMLQKLQSDVDALIDYNLLEIKDNYLKLSTKGLILSSEVMLRLMKIF